MMRKVKRDEILDYVTYTEKRPEIRPQFIQAKDLRRVHLGDYFTFLFENTDTILYQIQEMMRVERIVKEDDIQHEMKTYNGLLGESGELGCTLLIEIDSKEDRDVLLKQWVDLPKHLYMTDNQGNKSYAIYDESQVGADKVSAVQYLKFKFNGAFPVKIGSDLPAISVESDLTDTQVQVLKGDLE